MTLFQPQEEGEERVQAGRRSSSSMDDNCSHECVEVPYRAKRVVARSVSPAPPPARSTVQVHKLQSMPRGLPSRQQAAAQTGHYGRAVAAVRRPSTASSSSSWCCCLFFVVAIAGIVVAVVYFVVLQGESSNLPELYDIWDVDPFEPASPENSTRWENSGNGLTIEVVNALDTQWHTYFEKSSKFIVSFCFVSFARVRRRNLGRCVRWCFVYWWWW